MRTEGWDRARERTGANPAGPVWRPAGAAAVPGRPFGGSLTVPILQVLKKNKPRPSEMRSLALKHAASEWCHLTWVQVLLPKPVPKEKVVGAATHVILNCLVAALKQ